MSQSIVAEALQFATEYGHFWAFPNSTLNEDDIPAAGGRAARYYRPGITFFTNGNIERFNVCIMTRPSVYVRVLY